MRWDIKGKVQHGGTNLGALQNQRVATAGYLFLPQAQQACSVGTESVLSIDFQKKMETLETTLVGRFYT